MSGTSPPAATSPAIYSLQTARIPPNYCTPWPGCASQWAWTRLAMADEVIASRIAPWADRLDTAEGVVYAARAAAGVVAALPRDQWAVHLTSTVARTGIGPSTALDEVFDAHQTWMGGAYSVARRRLTNHLPGPLAAGLSTVDTEPSPPSGTVAARMPTSSDTEQLTRSPHDRWAEFGESLLPGLTNDPGWGPLAASFERATQAGYDVHGQVAALVARNPLPAAHTARSLQFRLAEQCPAFQPPYHPATGPIERTSGGAPIEIRHDSPSPSIDTRSWIKS